ncbi:MAG: Cell division FtsK/SpoIIIE [Candidatus Gottesmanbacteria bacterium GW2011_GWA2_41_12]|uniref:Cell division FtsK/SpoIIIE n=2 Tax=Candidatus Gottesmaniibacteriota TaxID=1752720 RepID=A0A0G0UIA0_9BACT|nr:MAG: Cell division FtsK/SpoIIIE [Candidatus Gottesmanbacteria bacterium GW2011_GWC2_39_8]KKR88553.1 MAG: Cell division FtsK/SpoIIIE [Candidatus Gottesmanbacteria bacterium GW2011_GWA2_41_12]
MARRYSRKFKLKIKKQNIYTLISLLLLGLAAFILISFFNQGPILEKINSYSQTYVGWGIYFLPVALVFLSFIFMKIRARFAKPRVSLGIWLSYISLLGLTQSGIVGSKIWTTLEVYISGAGAAFILVAAVSIGLMVLFNTSLDEVVNMFIGIVNSIKKIFKKPSLGRKFPDKKVPAVFVDSKVDRKKELPSDILPHAASKLEKSIKPPISKPTQENTIGLGMEVIRNIPSEAEIWEYPPFTLLSGGPGQHKADRGDVKRNASVIERTLESFGVTARVVEINYGPAVTQYALEIALGTKLSKITSLSNDLALALAAPTGQIRIEAPIPGRSLVGIEIPNRSLEYVTLRQMLASDMMKNDKLKLAVALGLDVSGTPVTANIAKMPHVLIAGTTGSGKSVLINSWISSLLYRTTPSEVRLILVDPKRVELIGYNGIPHLLTPVIVEPDKILSALKWATNEMDRRYKMFAEAGVRNIDSFNEQSGFQQVPFIVIFIDELADLMAYAPVEVEDSICRLAQMARATGIHLVVATQRPSVDVITGLIKANIPTRIAFNVSSMIDSRVIMDMPGAEKLLGKGDMLYIPPDQAKPTRIQGTFVSEGEVTKLVTFLKSKNIPVEYTEEVTSIPVTLKKSSTAGGQGTASEDGHDALFENAVRTVCQHDRASASLLQRRLSIGYARAARLIDQLEEEGIIGPGEGSKPRDVLVRNAEEYLNGQTQEKTETA